MKYFITGLFFWMCSLASAQIMLPVYHGAFNKTANSSYYNALNFSTSLQNYASLPAATYFSGDFTIECWVNPSAYTNWSRIIDFGNGAGNNNVLFATSNGPSGQPGFYVGGAAFQADAQIPLNQWTHLAATLSGTTATIYINGIASGTANFPVPANVTRNKNYIGRSNWGWGDPAPSASFDDLRIWSVAKTGSEILASMNNELSGTESNLVAYFKFNEGVACGINTAITTLTNSAATGAKYNATLNGFTLNNSCVSNFVKGKLIVLKDGLTSETAGTSAYQIKQDYPTSTDGIYWIVNPNINGGAAFKIYADMTTDGGGWTLIMQNNYVDWDFSNALLRNQTAPPSTIATGIGDDGSNCYSIIGWADYIKRSAIGFDYMIDATARNRNGGIWRANEAYSFVEQTNVNTTYFGSDPITSSDGFHQNITELQKFPIGIGDPSDSQVWAYDQSGLEHRMPWYANDPDNPGSFNVPNAIITTTHDDGGYAWWGTLIAGDNGWRPAPWIEGGGCEVCMPDPLIIWYWVR